MSVFVIIHTKVDDIENHHREIVTPHRFHELGYDLAVVGLSVVDFGVDDDEDAHRCCLLS